MKKVIGALSSRIGVIIILTSLPLLAQQNVGNIVGTVRDPSGAIVPGATVTLTNTATQLRQIAHTNSSGFYSIRALPVGEYNLVVTLAGFQTFRRLDIPVIAGETDTIDVRLTVGRQTQTVTVTSTGPLLDISTSTVAATRTNAEIQALPITLYGNSSRSAISIAKTLNGVSYDPNESGGQEFMVIGRAMINGTPDGEWSYTIDGVAGSVQGGEREHDMEAPTPDMIQQVRVTTNTDVSEPFSPGTSVDLVTKSGTNQFHGALYEYLRNQGLDSRDTFLPTVPQDQQNNFGFAVGGPVIIPHVYNGKDKTFFFASWDFYRFRSTFAGSGGEEATTASVATQAMRNGDFSATLGPQIGTDALGRPVFQGQIYDPTTTRTLPNGTIVRDPYPGNIIPPGQLSAISKQVIAQEALPNLPGLLENNWVGPNAEVRVDKDQLSLKFDQIINSNNRASFEWDMLTPWTDFGETHGIDTGFSGHSFVDYGFGYLPPQQGESAGFIDDRSQYRLNFNYVWTAKPNLLVNFRTGVIGNPNRLISWFPFQGPSATFGSTIGLKGTLDPHAPRVNVQGYSAIGPGFDHGLSPFSTVPADIDVNWIRGKHSFKFGVNYDSTHAIAISQGGGYGTFNFDNVESGLPGFPTTGWGMASMMLGQVDSGTVSTPTNNYGVTGGWGLYAQDTWRMNKKLTLTTGVRWDYFMPMYDHLDEISDFDPNLPNPGADGRLGALTFFGNGPGRDGLKTMETPYYRAWGGQLGIAYALNSKTVIRGNFGISYPAAWMEWTTVLGTGYPTTGFSDSLTAASVNNGITPAFNWENGFPLTFPQLPLIDPTLLNGTVSGYFNRNENRPPMYETPSFQVQREFRGNLLLSVGYAGTFVHRMYETGLNDLQALPLADYPKYGSLLNADINSPAALAAGIPLPYPGFSGTVAQALLPYPQYLNVPVLGAGDGNSIYNALQVSVAKHMGHGLMLNVAYTLSKTLTNVDKFVGGQAGGSIQSPFMKNTAKAIAREDEPQILALSWDYQLPFGPGKRFLNGSGPLDKILGNWRLSAIQNYWGGRPITVTTEATIPFASLWPLMVPGQPIGSTSCGSYNIGDPNSRILNPQAFATPAPFTFGNVSTLPTVRNCGYAEEDFGLDKEIKISESKDFRIGTFWQNAFNRVDYIPEELNTDMNSPAFGRYGDAYPGRKIQLYMRFEF